MPHHAALFVMKAVGGGLVKKDSLLRFCLLNSLLGCILHNVHSDH